MNRTLSIWAAYPVAFVAILAMQTAYRLVWRKKPIRAL